MKEKERKKNALGEPYLPPDTQMSALPETAVLPVWGEIILCPAELIVYNWRVLCVSHRLTFRG